MSPTSERKLKLKKKNVLKEFFSHPPTLLCFLTFSTGCSREQSHDFAWVQQDPIFCPGVGAVGSLCVSHGDGLSSANAGPGLDLWFPLAREAGLLMGLERSVPAVARSWGANRPDKQTHFPGPARNKAPACQGPVSPLLPAAAAYSFDRSWNAAPSLPLSPASSC